MSEPSSETHSSWIKTPKQLLIVVVLAFTLTVAIILALVELVIAPDVGPDHPGMSAEAVAQRLEPVGKVVISDEPLPAKQAAAPAAAPQAAPAMPAPAAAGGAKNGAGDGQAVYQQACAACHAAGVAGAPKLGDQAAWAPRMKSGLDALYQAAIKGKGAMPPKGGQTQLSDAEVKAAVDYMVKQVK